MNNLSLSEAQTGAGIPQKKPASKRLNAGDSLRTRGNNQLTTWQTALLKVRAYGAFSLFEALDTYPVLPKGKENILTSPPSEGLGEASGKAWSGLSSFI